MSHATIHLPDTSGHDDAALRSWYANVPHELTAGILSADEIAYAAEYYREAGLLTWWRRPFFRRHFEESFSVAAGYLLGSTATGAILDLGCGTGTQALYLALHGARVVGVDMDGTALEIFRKRQAFYEELGGRALDVTMIEGDVFTLDYSRIGPLRGLYSMFAFNMMQPSSRLLADVTDAMALGGRFVVIDGNNGSLLARLWPGRRRDVWSPAEFATALQDDGYRIDRHEGGVVLPPQIWRWLPYSLLAGIDRGLCSSLGLAVSHQIQAEKIVAKTKEMP